MSSCTPPMAHCAQKTPSTGGDSFRRDRLITHFFLDFSNIAISAAQLAPKHGDGVLEARFIRLHCENLRRFVERERIWGSGYASAGLMDQRSPIKQHFERVGITFEICERGCISGSEQNVDERIQLEMSRLLWSNAEPGVVVLATGDGKCNERNSGFIGPLQALHERGYTVEVMSWRHSFSAELKRWASEHGRAIELDEFYPELTFVSGRRNASSYQLLNRKLARCLAA